MTIKQAALALMASSLLALPGFADGDDGPRCRNCPAGDYSVLHYWFPGWYEARAEFHPKNFDQYPPRPAPARRCRRAMSTANTAAPAPRRPRVRRMRTRRRIMGGRLRRGEGKPY